MHWCFDCTNKCHSDYFMYMPPIGHMDWIGLDLENWTHVQLCTRHDLVVGYKNITVQLQAQQCVTI